MGRGPIRETKESKNVAIFFLHCCSVEVCVTLVVVCGGQPTEHVLVHISMLRKQGSICKNYTYTIRANFQLSDTYLIITPHIDNE